MTVLRRAELEEIYTPIEKELKEFEALLKKELASGDELIQNIHGHLLKMAGKFLRPALAILSSKTGDKAGDEAVKLSVAIELIHTATLVHDDIIDGSELRRNQPSVHSKWGREISIVSGDYLYAKAFMLLAGFGDEWMNRAFSACAHVMCEGEMKQIEKRNDFLMSVEDYLKIIHQKTASLFQAACAGGAYCSEAGAQTIERLGRYGYHLGMAFQIVDDCLDLTGDSRTLGKTAGLDVLKNDVTLPLLFLFQELEPSEKQALQADIRRQTPGVFERVNRLAQAKKSVEKTMDKAREYAEKAIESLSGVKDSVYKESLSQLVYYCLDRMR